MIKKIKFFLSIVYMITQVENKFINIRNLKKIYIIKSR